MKQDDVYLHNCISTIESVFSLDISDVQVDTTWITVGTTKSFEKCMYTFFEF